MTLSNQYLYQDFIHKSRYARYLDDKQRREHWHDTVDRYMSFILAHIKEKHDVVLPPALRQEIEEAITK